MRVTRSLIPTLREEPADAEAISHKLMLRAGLVRQLGAGIFVWLPMGQRVCDKITGIIRAVRVSLQDTARVENEVIYRTLSVDEGASFEGRARPRPNPLAEETGLSPTADLRQKVAPVGPPGANGAAANSQPTQAEATAANPDGQRRLEQTSPASR